MITEGINGVEPVFFPCRTSTKGLGSARLGDTHGEKDDQGHHNQDKQRHPQPSNNIGRHNDTLKILNGRDMDKFIYYISL